jgi:hypothetical protein
MSFESTKKIADAVLYEGYVLYPYRASAAKNRLRFQFGVLAPRQWSDSGGCEQWWMSTECIAEAHPEARVSGKVRFLQMQRRTVEEAHGNSFQTVESVDIDGKLFASWDEGIEREVSFEFSLGANALEHEIHFEFPLARAVEPITNSRGAVAARIVRQMIALNGVIRLAAIAAVDRLVRLTIRIENETPWPEIESGRDEALRGSFIGAHTLLAIAGGNFVSLTGSARVCACGRRAMHERPHLAGAGRRKRDPRYGPVVADHSSGLSRDCAGESRRPVRWDRDR